MKYFLSLSERDLFTRVGNDFYPGCHLFTASEINSLDFRQKIPFVTVEIKKNKTHVAFGVRHPNISECVVTVIFENKTIVFAGVFHGIIVTIKKVIKDNKEKCIYVSIRHKEVGE